jgi:hypothetical protein
LAVAAAEIFVCRLSQSMFTIFTVMPLLLVKASSVARGGAVPGKTTVIVTPFVCVEAAPPPPPPEHAATIRLRQATPATSTAPLVWFRIDFICSGLPWVALVLGHARMRCADRALSTGECKTRT